MCLDLQAKSHVAVLAQFYNEITTIQSNRGLYLYLEPSACSYMTKETPPLVFEAIYD
jgi:hypothetical protein